MRKGTRKGKRLHPVQVVDHEGARLNNCSRPRARTLLASGRATLLRGGPFTVLQLLPPGPATAEGN